MQHTLHRNQHTADHILLVVTRGSVWEELRVPAADVHQLVCGSGSGWQLDRVCCGVFLIVSEDRDRFLEQ